MSIKERRSTRLNTGKYRSNSSSGKPPSWDSRSSKLRPPKEQEFLRRMDLRQEGTRRDMGHLRVRIAAQEVLHPHAKGEAWCKKIGSGRNRAYCYRATDGCQRQNLARQN